MQNQDKNLKTAGTIASCWKLWVDGEGLVGENKIFD